jgi:hypothetical protein
VVALRGLENEIERLVGLVVNKTKLKRAGYIPSFLQTKGFSVGNEPNMGPYPQYNFIFEDEPFEDVVDHLSKPRRHYKSNIRDELVRMLGKSTHDLTHIQTVMLNPRTLQTETPLYKQSRKKYRPDSPQSLLQDHEQFIEDNPSPYQEITVHAESLAPEGGNAPVMPRPPYNFLHLNRTAETMELTLLSTEENSLLKQLEDIAKRIKPAK